MSTVTALAVSPIIIADSTSGTTGPVEIETLEVEPVEVETVDVDAAKTSSSTTTSSSHTESGQLWDKTKKEAGEAASAAGDFSKEQGSRAVEGTKKGVAKGAEAVTTVSKKAWEGTKEGVSKGASAVSSASKKAWEATRETTGKVVEKTGEVVENVIGDDSPAPVSDRSIEQGSSSGN